MPHEDLCYLPTTELAAAIRTAPLPRGLTTAILDRIEQLNRCTKIGSIWSCHCARCAPHRAARVGALRSRTAPTPQQLAGMRMDPAKSLPSASGPRPAAKAAAAPPPEPSAIRSSARGCA
jgi:hypothetical protein